LGKGPGQEEGQGGAVKTTVPYYNVLDPGWVCLSKPQGERGFWMRVAPQAIEICAGPFGDDGYVKLARGGKVGKRKIAAARECLAAFVYALEMAHGDAAGEMTWDDQAFKPKKSKRR
jgi:hypothetical protein